MTGLELREEIRTEMFGRCMGPAAPYNLQSTTNGIACTTASVVSAALGIGDLNALTEEQKAQIKQLHLLLVVYNAFQPGVFALSGWDLVGALPLPPAEVAHLMGDGDTRWINRGSYDLLGKGGSAELPPAPALYGPLPAQLADPDSFASQLKGLLALREKHRIYEGTQIAVLGEGSLLVMVHRLPDAGGLQLTALNFGPAPVEQTVTLPQAVSGALIDLLSGTELLMLDNACAVPISLAGHRFLLAHIP